MVRTRKDSCAASATGTTTLPTLSRTQQQGLDTPSRRNMPHASGLIKAVTHHPDRKLFSCSVGTHHPHKRRVACEWLDQGNRAGQHHPHPGPSRPAYTPPLL
eukprot:363711-Chlamydomonas_euryale.AAC.16